MLVEDWCPIDLNPNHFILFKSKENGGGGGRQHENNRKNINKNCVTYMIASTWERPTTTQNNTRLDIWIMWGREFLVLFDPSPRRNRFFSSSTIVWALGIQVSRNEKKRLWWRTEFWILFFIFKSKGSVEGKPNAGVMEFLRDRQRQHIFGLWR